MRRGFTGLRPGWGRTLAVALCAATGVFAAGAATLKLETTAGKDYKEANVASKVTGAAAGDRLKLSVTDPAGATTVRDLSTEPQTNVFSNLTAGRPVVLDGYVTDGTVTNAAAHELFMMGRVHDTDDAETGNWNDRWLYETAETYTNGTGTGVWSGTDYMSVSNGQIVVDTTLAKSATAAAACSVGTVPSPRRGCVLFAELTFSAPYDDLPDPANQSVGLTTVIVDEDVPEVANFVYLENGSWHVVPVSVCDPLLTTKWQAHIAVDLDRQTATYCVRPSTNDSWTILGTASGLASDSIHEVSFRGSGAVSSVRGHGYDTHLVKFDVQFDDLNLRPGCNFEETVVTGRVVTSIVHDTSVSGGSYVVRLTGLDGSVIETSDFTFTSEGTMEFYVPASGLTPGTTYRAEVILGEELADVTDVEGAFQSAVMGRALTNEFWASTNLWIYETAVTFTNGMGSGVWTGTNYAMTAGEWICVDTFQEVTVPVETETLVFEPTNDIPETYSTLVASIRTVFSEICISPDETDAAFGFTLSAVDDEPCFMCLSNGVWQVIPRSVVVPVLGVEYELRAYVEKDSMTMSYVLQQEDGRQITMLSFALEPDRFVDLVGVEVVGVGHVTDLMGQLYSTELLRIHVDFDWNTLYPGTNFEATAANGHITFERLWETDHTNGQLSVVVRDKYGLIIGRRRISFADLKGFDFKYYVEGLTPGENYSVDVIADVKGIDSDSSEKEGIMARVVSNGWWSAEGWVRENAETFAGVIPGTGLWTTGTVIAATNDDCISFNTSMCDDDSEHLDFQATNALPYHTGFEYRMRVLVDSTADVLPTQTAPYGLTVLGVRDPDTDELLYCQFAVLTNGAWATVDTGVYEPETDVEYELTLHADFQRHEAYYAIQSAKDKRAVVLFEYELAGDLNEAPYRTEFYGIGRIRTHEGDGFDVRVAEIETEFTDFMAGTNFTQTIAHGVLRIRQLWDTDKTDGDCTILIYDAYGNLVATNTVAYHSLTNQDLHVIVGDLQPGQVYDIEVVTTLDDDVVGSGIATVVTARKLGSWICEDAETFAHEKTGTGDWVNTNECTEVVGSGEDRAIRFSVFDGENPAGFHPTNDTLSIRKSTIREIRFDVDFEQPGWYASTGEAPAFPSNLLAAATVWCDDAVENASGDYDTALAVVTTNGAWTILEETRNMFSAADPCQLTVLIDQETGYVRYTVVTPTYTNRVYRYDFEPTGPKNLEIGFLGTGNVRSLDGDAWDRNLIASATNEFADLNEAILGTDPDDILSPLWYAEQWVTVWKDSFTVYDPTNLLTIHFPEWYYVVITEGGGVKVYKFNSSNNWIDYAEDGEENIVTNGNLFVVKTPEGLSWIAALATNEWVSGRIELATNIDLTVHNWTPIAGFSGEFDGRGWTIDGLNNTNRFVGVPGSEYVYGPTNQWGRSTYGLFGTATNATLANVTFTDVAISNLADTVATLVGALAGDCAVTNVTVESGSILGAGGTVAGLAGYADFTHLLEFVNNTNRAAIASENAIYGDPRYTAGILCVAGPTNAAAPLGTVVVTNNVNAGLVSGTLYDVGLLGGNLAQILVGTTPGARFGEVHLTNNLALGSADPFLEQSDYNSIVATNYPVVNLAPAYWGMTADEIFLRALDANVPGAIAVDPYLRTARMLSDLFANGAENPAGRLNDEITTKPSSASSTVTMTEGLDSWDAIRIDRDLTFDLNGQTIFTIYINNTFVISEGVSATVKNGKIVVGAESQPFVGATPTQENLTIQTLTEDFYERTTMEINGEFTSVLDLPLQALNTAGTVISVYEDSAVSIDLESGALCLEGVPFAKLSDAYAFSIVMDDDGEVIGYRVRLADTAANMPTATVSIGAETVSVVVGNTRAGMTYTLQQKTSLVEKEWTTVGEGVAVTADNESVTLEAPAEGAQGYYRILATETPAAE